MPERPRPLFRWLGAKWALAPWIVGAMPDHRVYVEPFGGSGAVLMSKAPAVHEIYNDADGELVNLFRVLREPATCNELARKLQHTPYARDEFRASYEPTSDKVEWARRTLVRGAMAHGSDAITRGYLTGFKTSTRQRGSDAKAFARLPDKLPAWLERLRGVSIENDDAMTVLQRYDSEAALHYVDPPYPWSTRRDGRAPGARAGKPKHGYRHELSDEQHVALAHVLCGLAGMVMLSGYDCPLYDELYAGWHTIRTETTDQANSRRTEVLWFNEAAWQASPINTPRPAMCTE